MTTYEFVKVRKRKEASTSTLQEEVCVCCLNKNTAMIPMKTCKHVDIFYEIVFNKLESDLWICHICHQMMRKYSEFKQQVSSSYRILTSTTTAKDQIVKHAVTLSKSKTKIIDIYTSTINNQLETAEQQNEHEEQYLKKEEDDAFSTEINSDETDIFTNNDNAEIDIKIERVTEQSNPLKLPSLNKPSGSKVQKHKRHLGKTQRDLIKEGKIIVKVLDQVEFENDRMNDALKASYVKLPYKCENCLFAYDFQQTLDEHLEKRHNKNVGSHHCDICKSYFDSVHVYNEHVARHYRRFECTICHKMLRAKQMAINHYESVHENVKRLYQCEDCAFVTDSVRKFNYHNEKHKGRPKCGRCDKTFVTKQGLKSHMFLIHKESDRTYSCDRCSKTFSSRSGLAHHVATHTENRTVSCVTCKKVYASEFSLRSHLMNHKAHRSEQSARFICEECGDKFTAKPQLKEHIEWTHLKIFRFKCDVCNKPFRTKRNVQRHKAVVHEKQRPVKNKICDYCGAAFSTSGILTCHIRTHTGDRPLHCKVCPATFAHPAALFNHNKIHK